MPRSEPGLAWVSRQVVAYMNANGGAPRPTTRTRVMVALDGSPASLAALRYAVDEARDAVRACSRSVCAPRCRRYAQALTMGMGSSLACEGSMELFQGSAGLCSGRCRGERAGRLR
ncbi:hypothetical protein EJK15_02785 [Nonomuraea basaltis]|nr:hypothetical protein EJK15_02785 [Nonomuraea basaltis]